MKINKIFCHSIAILINKNKFYQKDNQEILNNNKKIWVINLKFRNNKQFKIKNLNFK